MIRLGRILGRADPVADSGLAFPADLRIACFQLLDVGGQVGFVGGVLRVGGGGQVGG